VIAQATQKGTRNVAESNQIRAKVKVAERLTSTTRLDRAPLIIGRNVIIGELA
jgi:hypothetical protein